MPVVNLTQQLVLSLSCPDGKDRIEYCDKTTPGLYMVKTSANPGNSTWFYRYKIDGQMRHQKLGRTSSLSLAEARKQVKLLQGQIALGGDPHREAKARKEVPTFSEFWDGQYMPYVRPRKRSWKRDDELYRLRIKERFGSKRLNQITRQSLQLFHTDLLKEGLAPATCDLHLRCLKHALYLGIDWGLMAGPNPAARIPMFNVDNSVQHLLEGEQLEALMDVLRTDKNRAICRIAMFLLATGSRLNEALSATWSQIDLKQRSWRIPALNSKSKRVRTVPLNDSAIAVLEELRRLDPNEEFESVFVNSRRKAAYTTIHKVWDRLRKKAGLPHLRIHDLRHQFASFLVNAGRTLYEVQMILGHSSPNVTQVYSHLSSKSLQAASNTASDAMRGPKAGKSVTAEQPGASQ